MYHLVENLRRIAILINPYMKHTSEKMLNQLNIPEELRTWDSLADYDKLVNIKVTDKYYLQDQKQNQKLKLLRK